MAARCGWRRVVAPALCAALLLVAGKAAAGQGSAVFTGKVGQRQYCQITIVQDGTFTADPTLSSLSTQNGGGVKAKALVDTSNGSFDITAENPPSFSTMPSGGDTGVSFSTLYHASGATSFSNVPGTTRKLRKGLTELLVDFSATRPDAFPEGDYAATVVLRCE
ncbi:MAG: hypothetical protein KDJ80_15635 [Nitratireductor sp.]|nr:hypothetical protein [Nitratireductor sp.]